MPTSLAAMLALINDNTSGDISAADVRDVIQGLYDWIPPVEKYALGRLPGETAHASDDFFATYTGYTEQAPTGTATWAATRGGLGCLHISVGSADMAVAVKAVPAAGVPCTIETQLRVPMWRLEANSGAGLVFTDGTATTSNIAAFGLMSSAAAQTAISMPTGTITNVTSNLASLGSNPAAMDKVFIRLIWSAANTFKVALSIDGAQWTDWSQTTFTRTFTPTHMGFWVTNWGIATQQQAVFSYLRVADADLGV